MAASSIRLLDAGCRLARRSRVAAGTSGRARANSPLRPSVRRGPAYLWNSRKGQHRNPPGLHRELLSQKDIDARPPAHSVQPGGISTCRRLRRNAGTYRAPAACAQGVMPRHRTRSDDRVPLRIGLVILLDVLEIVEIVDHQAVRLRERALRRVGEKVEPFEPRAVAEMEARDRIDRRAALGARADNTRPPPASAAHAPSRWSPDRATNRRGRGRRALHGRRH